MRFFKVWCQRSILPGAGRCAAQVLHAIVFEPVGQICTSRAGLSLPGGALRTIRSLPALGGLSFLDPLLPPGALLLPCRLFLAAFGLPPLLLALERGGGFPGFLLAEFGRRPILQLWTAALGPAV
jgi:hypothetical protein